MRGDFTFLDADGQVSSLSDRLRGRHGPLLNRAFKPDMNLEGFITRLTHLGPAVGGIACLAMLTKSWKLGWKLKAERMVSSLLSLELGAYLCPRA
jgi:hypothetical protein